MTSWFADVRFSVSGWSTRSKFKAPYLQARSHVGVQPWLPRRKGGEGDGLVAGWRTGSKWSQEFCTPSLSTLITSHTHTHTLSLSLSLSLSHYTHTHTFRSANCYDFAVACSGQSLHATLAPKMLQSLAEKSTWFYFLAQRLNSPSPPPPPLPSPASPPSLPRQPPPPPSTLSLSKQRSFAKSEPNLLRRIASFYEDAVMCSLSIALRQTCARGRGHHHFELSPVGRPGAAEEEGREGWRRMTRTVEGGGGGGGSGGVWTCPFTFTLCLLSPSQHTHTHTHTHTHFSFFFLVIIRAHT